MILLKLIVILNICLCLCLTFIYYCHGNPQAPNETDSTNTSDVDTAQNSTNILPESVVPKSESPEATKDPPDEVPPPAVPPAPSEGEAKSESVHPTVSMEPPLVVLGTEHAEEKKEPDPSTIPPVADSQVSPSPTPNETSTPPIEETADSLKSSASETAPRDPILTPDHTETENMPTFTEYQKMLADENKKKDHVSLDIADKKRSTKVMQKNVAGLDCGAKMLHFNPEAQNPSYLLNSNKDEYMNQRCSANKWFIIETCEAVQPRIVEIANFELFSSRLKTFKVYISDRYPVKQWVFLGVFLARDDKGMQTFEAVEDKYVKFFKFELIDHYGTEHYCPLSMVRIFGTVDELEDDHESQLGATSETEESSDIVHDQAAATESPGLLKKATNMLVNMVKSSLQKDEPAGTDNSSEEADKSGGHILDGDSTCTQDIELLLSLLRLSPYSTQLRRCLYLIRQYRIYPPMGMHSTFATLQSHLFSGPSLPSPLKAFPICTHVQSMVNITTTQLSRLYLAYNNVSFSTEHDYSSHFRQFLPSLTPHVLPPKQSQPSTDSSKTPSTITPPGAKDPTTPSSADVNTPINQSEATKPAEVQSEAPSHPEADVPKPPGSTVERVDLTPKTNIDPAEFTKIDPIPEEVPATKPATEKSDIPRSHDTSLPEIDSTSAQPTHPDASLPPSIKLKGDDAPVETSDVIPDSERPPSPEVQDGGVSEEEKGTPETHENTTTTTPSPPDPSSSNMKPPVNTKLSEDTGAKPPGNAKLPEDTGSKPIEGGGEESDSPTTPGYETGGSSSVAWETNGSGRKDTIYMRLNNKMKAIELNVTVSMKYLEELSQSYKRQMERLSRYFNVTLDRLKQTAQDAEMRDKVQQSRIGRLDADVSRLRTRLGQCEHRLRAWWWGEENKGTSLTLMERLWVWGAAAFTAQQLMLHLLLAGTIQVLFFYYVMSPLIQRHCSDALTSLHTANHSADVHTVISQSKVIDNLRSEASPGHNRRTSDPVPVLYHTDPPVTMGSVHPHLLPPSGDLTSFSPRPFVRPLYSRSTEDLYRQNGSTPSLHLMEPSFIIQESTNGNTTGNHKSKKSKKKRTSEHSQPPSSSSSTTSQDQVYRHHKLSMPHYSNGDQWHTDNCSIPHYPQPYLRSSPPTQQHTISPCTNIKPNFTNNFTPGDLSGSSLNIRKL